MKKNAQLSGVNFIFKRLELIFRRHNLDTVFKHNKNRKEEILALELSVVKKPLEKSTYLNVSILT